MELRILALIAFCGVMVAAYGWMQRNQLRQAGRAVMNDLTIQRDSPVIYYFKTPDCMTCTYAQEPALEQLSAQMTIEIIRVDVAESPELARQWGVMTAPTTFVLKPDGTPFRVNNGFVHAAQLQKQIAEAYH